MAEGTDHIQLEETWKEVLLDQFQSDYMSELRAFLAEKKLAGQTIYPPSSRWFEALNRTPFNQVRVVIIGQDPYHGPGQAHGLCFSVRTGVALPPSLQNIFREIKSDLAEADTDVAKTADFQAGHGDLTPWANQGVLLLNSVLTVERSKAGSHQGHGWEQFTDRIVQLLTANKEGLVFMLWGNHAQRKGAQIDRLRHLVLTSPHPSPFSAHQGFFGCRHFSRCNKYLAEHDQPAIDWFQVD